MVFIHPSSVNSRRREAGGPEEASTSFNPAEKRLYAFGEKARSVPLGAKDSSGQTTLRAVTRLDPMTYMLFGAHQIVVKQSGLECDSWLPVVGNLHALDDIQRLKTLLDGCMLRVFEGLGKSLVRGRDARRVRAKDNVDVNVGRGSSRIETGDEGDEGEIESDEDGEDDGEGVEVAKKRVVEPLSMEEIRELELLTTDVVKILDAYASEREGGSTYPSRSVTPGLASAPGGEGVGPGSGIYRPPGATIRR